MATKKQEKKVQKFVVRCDRAGVFYGEIVMRKEGDVVMANVRKLWHWSGANSVEDLAMTGVTDPSGCQFTVWVPEMTVMNPVQILPCTDKAKASIEGVREWKRG